MKFTIILLAITICQVKASIFAQKISISVKNASLTEVISQIRKQTKIDILYNNGSIANLKPITLEAKNEGLKEVLDKCFKDQPLTYHIVNNSILITIKPVEQSAAPAAQPVSTITSGKITGDKGEPLPGVTVKVKNTSTAVASNTNGEYKITVPDGGVLVFSFIGYEPQEVAVNGRESINVALKPQNTGLNEIVVVGYGTQKQKDLTGAVSSLTADKFNKGPALAPQQLMQGKIAGVAISQNSGKPGASNTVRIRGGTSVTSTNDPLYVVDGVPLSVTAGVSQASIRGNGTDVFDEEPINPLQTINPNDIESISVLKDASATAIYGSRGANGVIVITTKSGKAGKAQVSYNGTLSTSNVAKELQMLNGDEYRSLVKAIGLGNLLDDKGGNTNWQDKIYRTGYSNDHNLSLSGGTDKTTYRVSLGYGKQSGIVLNSDLQQANMLTSINHSALDNKLKFNLKISYGQNKANVAPISNTVGGESGTSMNYEAYVFNPTYPVYDPSGNYYHVPPFRVNPVSFSTDVTDQKTNQRLLGNLMTSYKIIDPLTLSVTLGYTRQSTDRNSYINKGNPIGNGFNGYASVQKYYDYSKLSETILRFNKTYGKHTIEALAGYSYQYFFEESDRITAQGFQSDDFKWYNLGSASTTPVVSSGAGSSKLISMYSRLNYNFDERFLVTGTLRRDGSSRFGSGHKWGYFPSGSIAYRLSQEKFFHIKPISDLKLRVSYGETGNQEIGNLNSLVLLSAGGAYIIGGQKITIVRPTTLANPDLRWESTAQLNIGLNFGLFGDRVHGAVDWYRKKTSDLLLQVPVVQPSVATTQLANVGSVENKGIEFELGASIIAKNNFSWDADFNISHNVNKVLSLSNDIYKGANIQTAPTQGTVALGTYTQLIQPGYALGTFYGRKFTGVDANGLETYDPAGNQVLGSAQPKITYGFGNTFNYKHWSLGVNMRGVYGNLIYNATANNLGYKQSLPGKNALRSVIDDGVSLNQPKNFSSRWLESGSFLRMDNATLGYTVPLKTKQVTNLRVFVMGQNLFVITKYKGIDPEVNAEISATGNAPLGVDYLGYPRARTFSLGCNITFQ